MHIYDVSVPIGAHTPVYPGDPGIDIQPWKALANGDSANVSSLHFGAHTATHVDAPAHFINGGAGVANLPLDVLIGPARVVETPPEMKEIDHDFVSGLDLQSVTRLLFKTRNSSFWYESNETFRTDFTYLTHPAAELLIAKGIRLVGIDYLSIEKFKSERHETHLALLDNGIVILEGLNLSEVSGGDYELICLPLLVAAGAGDGAPARTVLRTLL
ncbi:MAG: arylformamidase [Blastocatellia bacterium]|jgi:arylformamidase|nr:arylformamidase [Blastocatellia bacterium]